MKTSLDSFLSLTSPENILSPLSRPLAIQEASDAQALTLLPEDVLLRIFSFFVHIYFMPNRLGIKNIL